MREIDRALSELSDIRSQMAASTRFRGYGPEAVAMTGVLSAAIVVVQLIWPSHLLSDAKGQALLWGGVLLAGCVAIVLEALGRARAQHEGMAGAMLVGAARTVGPISFVCLALGAVVLMRAPQAAWLLPGTWQMLVGVAAFASYATMPRGIVWPGVWYLLAGCVTLLFSTSQAAIAPIVNGVPFVVGHLWIAWLLGREGRASA